MLTREVPYEAPDRSPPIKSRKKPWQRRLMPEVTVGMRRLYDAMGCTLETGEELNISVDFSLGQRGTLYMGPKPRFGIWTCTSDRYFVPGAAAVMMAGNYHADATASDHPRSFFTEIAVSDDVSVDEELHRQFLANHQEARQRIMSIAVERSERFAGLLDLLAGTMGLRFHRQLVLELLNENHFALRPDAAPVINYSGTDVETLEPVTLLDRGVGILQSILPMLATVDVDTLSKTSSVLNWLMRAWRERDVVNQFVALFVPLECILAGYGSSDPTHKKSARKVRRILRKHGGEDVAELLSFFDRLAGGSRPSLESRFRVLAEQGGLPGWERDVEAFGRFNKLRNALMHRGQQPVTTHVVVGDKERRSLEDLVERYVCFSLYHDFNIYQSRWRPEREGQHENGEA